MSSFSNKIALGIVGYGVMGRALGRVFNDSDELRDRFSLKILARSRAADSDSSSAFSFAASLQELASWADALIIAVRSEQTTDLIAELHRSLPPGQADKERLLISLASGVTLSALEAAGGGKFAVARLMPNIFLEVKRGAFGFCPEKEFSLKHREIIYSFFGSLGSIFEIDESQMNVFTALAGCGPGFMFYIMDAFIEAGVSVGLTRQISRELTEGLMGACAALASSTGLHPMELREQGVSPAGMTIAGLNHLDRRAVRGHIIDAIRACCEQGKKMDSELD